MGDLHLQTPAPWIYNSSHSSATISNIGFHDASCFKTDQTFDVSGQSLDNHIDYVTVGTTSSFA